MLRIAAVSVAVLAGVLLYACGRDASLPDEAMLLLPEPELPESRWDANPRSDIWTEATLAALDAHGAPLVAMVPGDIGNYCPAYADNSDEDRKAFWVNFIASLARHESTWRPEVSGGDGRWHGLLQISPGTARAYGCVADDAGDLKNGALNLSCGIRIMAETVARDGVISAGMRGVAADWGPFHQRRKRQDIQSYTSNLDVCAL